MRKDKKSKVHLHNELAHLKHDSGDKIFEENVRLLIADALIRTHFEINSQKVLQHCSGAFWKWNGIKYVELSESAVRQLIYDFLTDLNSMEEFFIFNGTFCPAIEHQAPQLSNLDGDCVEKMSYAQRQYQLLKIGDRIIENCRKVIFTNKKKTIPSILNWCKEIGSPKHVMLADAGCSRIRST